MTFRFILRRDEIQRIIRIARITWQKGVVGFGAGGYSAKLSIAASARLFAWSHESRTDYEVTLFGIRVHYCRSYGGIFAA